MRPNLYALALAPVLHGLLVGCAEAQTPAPTPATAPADAPEPRGYVGISIDGQATLRGDQIKESTHPTVAEVRRGSPAEKAGLRTGDIILEINGRDARERGSFLLRPQVTYTLRIRRGSEERELTLVPTAPPSDAARPKR